MASINYVIVSKKNGLYDRISREISEEVPDASVTRVDSMREGVAMLETEGKGIIFADLTEVLKKFPNIRRLERRRALARDRSGSGRDKNDQADLGLVKMYIRMHLEEELTLDTLAEFACLTPNYLSTMFKHELGLSVHQFVEQSRMQRAAYLILTEDSPVSEIAIRVGYPHTSYFCRVFKQFYGTSPLQYRLRNKREEERKT